MCSTQNMSREIHPDVLDYLKKFGSPNQNIEFAIVNVELLHFPDECQTGLNLISKIVVLEENRHIFQVCGRKEDVQTAIERGRAIIHKRLIDCMTWS